jgi:hypothetical protein
VLPVDAFALGETTKGSNDIGGFGEGFKLALLVLTRESRKPVIRFGTNLAVCGFEEVDNFSSPLFEILVEHHCEQLKGTSFTFTISEDEWKMLQHKLSPMADNPLPMPKFVNILHDRPGEIFVNGLFVCKEERFKYGYNFSPRHIQLGSDRQIANPLGLAWETSRYWADDVHGNEQHILRMMTEEVLDVQDIHYHISEYDAKLITKAFNAKFGDVTIKPMGSSLGYGMHVGGSMYSTIKKSGYMKIANPHEEAGTPFSELTEFYEANKKHMRRAARVAFNVQLEKAKNWK